MSVPAASSVQKMQMTCQIMYAGNILGTMSVSGFIPCDSAFAFGVSVSVRFKPLGIWSDKFAPSMVDGMQFLVARDSMICEFVYSSHTNIAAVFAICSCNAHQRGRRKSQAISFTRHSDWRVQANSWCTEPGKRNPELRSEANRPVERTPDIRVHGVLSIAARELWSLQPSPRGTFILSFCLLMVKRVRPWYDMESTKHRQKETSSRKCSHKLLFSKGPNLEKKAISLEIVMLAWKVCNLTSKIQSRPSEFPRNKRPWWVARLFSLENFNPGGRSWNVLIFEPLGLTTSWCEDTCQKDSSLKGCGGLDGPIRANQFADSHESPGSRELLEGSRTEPPFLRTAFRALKKLRIAGLRQFARITETLWKWRFSRESIRTLSQKCSRKCLTECTRRCPQKCPRKLRILVSNAPRGPHEDSQDSAHSKFDSARTKLYMKVCSVNFLGSAFGRSDFFSRIFIFEPPIFSQMLSPKWFSSSLWGQQSAQKNLPGESLAKCSNNYTTKIPDNFSAEGRCLKFAHVLF